MELITAKTPPIARRVNGVLKQAGLLAQASSSSQPSHPPLTSQCVNILLSIMIPKIKTDKTAQIS